MSAMNQVKDAVTSLGLALRSTGRPLHQANAQEIEQVARDKKLAEEVVRCAAWKAAPLSVALRLQIPVLLVDKTAEEGRVHKLELALLKAEHWVGSTGFVPAASMRDFSYDAQFQQSFATAREALNQLDQAHPLWPANAGWAIRWQLQGLKDHETLGGGSLGGALATGVIALLNDNQLLPPDHSDLPSLRAVHGIDLTSIAISAEITADANLGPVEDLDLKRIAAPTLTVFTGGTDLKPTVKPQPAALAASSNPPAKNHVIHAASLRELFCLLRELQRKSISVQAPNAGHARLFLATSVMVLLMLGYISMQLYWQHQQTAKNAEMAEQERIAKDQEAAKWARPTTEMLREKLPDASVDEAVMPEGCKHVIVLDHFDPVTWKQDVQPVLKQLRDPFALVIGRQEKRDHMSRERCALEGLGDLAMLASLTLVKTRVSELERLARLTELRQLVVVDAGVKDLRGVAALKKLQTLVLDSAYIQELPVEWNLPELRSLFLHVRSGATTISVGGMPALEHLAIAGAKLEQINGLEKCVQLERLTLSGPVLRLESMLSMPKLKGLEVYNSQSTPKLSFASMPKLASLVIARCNTEHILGWEQVPNLKFIKIVNCPSFELSGPKVLPHLESSTFIGCKGVDMTVLMNSTRLKRLQVAGTPLANQHVLQWMMNLRELDLCGIRLIEMPPLTRLYQLAWLNLSHSMLKRSPRLPFWKRCMVTSEGSTFGSDLKSKNLAEPKAPKTLYFPSSNYSYDNDAGYDSSYGEYQAYDSSYSSYPPYDSGYGGYGDYYTYTPYTYSTDSFYSGEYYDSVSYYSGDYPRRIPVFFTYAPSDVYDYDYGTYGYDSYGDFGLPKGYQAQLYPDPENPLIDVQQEFWKSSEWPDACVMIIRRRCLRGWGLPNSLGIRISR